MKEMWKKINEYDGYEISNLGKIRSFKKDKNNFILKQRITKGGYLRITLYKNGMAKKYLVHRLVAQTFIPNPENKPQINHLDGNKQNNKVDNLEWCTNSENQKHAYKTGLEKPRCPHPKQVNQYDLEGNFIKQWDTIKNASRNLNIKDSNISRACKNKSKTAGGYIWKYVNEDWYYQTAEGCGAFE